MAKKQLYCAEAERLYVIEQCTFAEIASRLKVNEKTVRSWKDAGDWEAKRLQYLKSRESFHEELYTFGRLLLKKIREDMEAGTQVDAGRLYTLTRIIPQLTRIKDYEEVARKKEGEGRAMSNDELVRLIEAQVLKLGDEKDDG
jgi:hypothetical protein